MRGALELPVTRIGHGVRAIEEPALVAELAERGIVLECCPTSNVVLGVYPSYAEHPLPQLAAAGVRVTLGSDDPPYFGASIGGEYARRARAASASTMPTARRSRAPRSRPRSATNCAQRLPNSATREAQTVGWRAGAEGINTEGGDRERETFRATALAVLAPRSRSSSPPAARATTTAASSSASAVEHDRVQGKPIKVGLVTDIGGLNDRSFNQSCVRGPASAPRRSSASRAASLTSKSNADYVPNLTTLAQQKYDLIDRASAS